MLERMQPLKPYQAPRLWPITDAHQIQKYDRLFGVTILRASTFCGTCKKPIAVKVNDPSELTAAMRKVGAVFHGVWCCSVDCATRVKPPESKVKSPKF
jgi:hypothetical protein